MRNPVAAMTESVSIRPPSASTAVPSSNRSSAATTRTRPSAPRPRVRRPRSGSRAGRGTRNRAARGRPAHRVQDPGSQLGECQTRSGRRRPSVGACWRYRAAGSARRVCRAGQCSAASAPRAARRSRPPQRGRPRSPHQSCRFPRPGRGGHGMRRDCGNPPSGRSRRPTRPANRVRTEHCSAPSPPRPDLLPSGRSTFSPPSRRPPGQHARRRYPCEHRGGGVPRTAADTRQRVHAPATSRTLAGFGNREGPTANEPCASAVCRIVSPRPRQPRHARERRHARLRARASRRSPARKPPRRSP